MTSAELQPLESASSHTSGGNGRFVHLDMLRGLAALAVVMGHLRGFFFVDFGQSSGTIPARIFYLLTGIHHQAVMVFFVLSGFLVGGSVIRSFGRGDWRWRRYLLQRLPRLWVVIVPALLLTLFWDVLGAHLSGGAGYAGRWFGQLGSGPDQRYDLTAATAVGNMLFLQTIVVPSFGSNGPLWSLANEFWYYLMFPLTLQVFAGQTLGARIIGILGVLTIAWFLPTTILWYGTIWLFGVISFLLFTAPRTCRVMATWPVVAVMAALVAISLVASRIQHWLGNDFLLGAAFALLVPGLARLDWSNHFYRRLSFVSSEVSYTLYLVHFPLLAFLYFAFLAPAQLTLSAGSLGIVALLLIVVLLYAGAVWWLFERNTARLRGMMAAALDRILAVRDVR